MQYAYVEHKRHVRVQDGAEPRDAVGFTHDTASAVSCSSDKRYDLTTGFDTASGDI